MGNWRGLALLGLLTLAGTAATAQTLNYTAPIAQNVAGTYTDLGTTGTAIATASTDDANSTPQNIGFGFNYNGQGFTQFILNTNGFLKLGTTAPSSAALFTLENQPTQGGPVNSINAADVNLLMPFNFDLEAGNGAGGAEYRVATTGTAPNRVCTIQWKNVSDKAGATPKHYANFSFQVKLYETTNVIEFVYGTATGTTAPATAAPHWATAGLKGTGPLQGQVLLISHASVNPWSTITYIDEPYVNSPTRVDNALNFRSTVTPDAGRTFRFAPQYANDIEVQLIYSLDRLPVSSGAPHVVQAVVRNVGTATQTLIPVTLTVAGANSFTSIKSVPSLTAGSAATVIFDGYTVTAPGTNTLTVSLLGDNNNSNNSATAAQQVTNNVFSVATTGPATGAVGFNASTSAFESAFAVKYAVGGPRLLTAITAYIYEDATSIAVGKTVYAAAYSSTGALLGRTPNYVVTAADANNRKTFTFPTPISLPAGEFLAGFVQANAAGGTNYFPMGTQAEVPTRPGTFFTLTGAGGTPNDASSRNFGRYMIEAAVTTVTGTSKALETAVSVYPNPSAGEFALDVRGANAKHGLQVEVSNLLGQRVYLGAARDNFENKLNLSHLANGLYTLKVKDGAQYMMRTISISK
ncbi:hypothetical protein DLM85_23955 [Hymenobacter edaphi]|uniref:Secretion system C-terminal sorting domain-containing protein n=1 Tax=Hymenobacter edaphi TaxID=2211146 RepID=A0A328B6I1_9BACT|nr:hypothetical protein DLM85_23955 [Hymenobacter edaphi]